LKATDEKIRIRIRNPLCGSKDLDSSHNVTDPEHWSEHIIKFSCSPEGVRGGGHGGHPLARGGGDYGSWQHWGAGWNAGDGGWAGGSRGWGAGGYDNWGGGGGRGGWAGPAPQPAAHRAAKGGAGGGSAPRAPR
jgi:hypothetical protein